MGQSHEMRVLLADNQAGATNAISLAVRGCDLIGDQVFGRDPGKRGTREQYACGARVLREDCAGGFSFYPTVAQLQWIIQRCIGDNIAGHPAGAAVPKATLPQIFAFVDKGDEIFRYDNLVVSSIAFGMAESDYVDVRVDFVGKDETSGVSWPATPPAIDCASEYVTPDVTLTVAGITYPFKSLNLTLDNAIADNQHENSLKRSIFESQDFAVSLEGTFGYRTATKALYRNGVAGTAGSVAMNNGAVSYIFTFGNLKIPGQGPTVPEEGEITMSLRGNAFATVAGSNQIAITQV